MDENLPEDYRIELAKAFVNDLFSKVKKCIDTVSSYARNEAQILPVIHLSQVLCIQLHPHSSLAPLCNFVCHPCPTPPPTRQALERTGPDPNSSDVARRPAAAAACDHLLGPACQDLGAGAGPFGPAGRGETRNDYKGPAWGPGTA